MTRGHDRHTVFQFAVIAAALLMAAFVSRELWRRWRPAPSVASVPNQPADESVPSRNVSGAAERSVSSVPRIRLSRIERRKPKPRAVPAP